MSKPLRDEIFKYLNGILMDVEIPVLQTKDRPQISLDSDSGVVEVVWVKRKEADREDPIV